MVCVRLLQVKGCLHPLLVLLHKGVLLTGFCFQHKRKNMFRAALTLLIFSGLMCGVSSAQQTWNLEKCLDYALSNNLDVQLSTIGVDQADVNLKQSQLSRLPNLNGSTSYGLSFGRFTNPDNLTIDASTSQNNSFSLNSSVPLFQGFGLVRGVRLAQDRRALAELDQGAAEDQVKLNVLAAYLRVLLALEDQRRNDVQIEVSRDNLSNSQRLANAGVIPEGNLRELEAQVATDELAVIQSQNAIAIAYLQLKLVMQADPEEEFSVEVPDPARMDALLAVENWDPKTIFLFAANNLPSFTGNALAEQIAQDNIALAKSDLYPSIGLSGGASTSWFTEKTLADFLPSYGTQLNNNFGQFVGIGLNIPIFNGGIVRSNIQSAELSFDRQKLTNQIELNTLRQTIEQAVADAKAASSSYRAASKVVEARQLALDFAQKRFEAGQAPSFELNNARNLLVASQVDLLTAKYNFVLASKTLEFYQGRKIEL